jgi:hypothetical protein
MCYNIILSSTEYVLERGKWRLQLHRLNSDFISQYVGLNVLSDDRKSGSFYCRTFDQRHIETGRQTFLTELFGVDCQFCNMIVSTLHVDTICDLFSVVCCAT